MRIPKFLPMWNFGMLKPSKDQYWCINHSISMVRMLKPAFSKKKRKNCPPRNKSFEISRDIMHKLVKFYMEKYACNQNNPPPHELGYLASFQVQTMLMLCLMHQCWSWPLDVRKVGGAIKKVHGRWTVLISPFHSKWTPHIQGIIIIHCRPNHAACPIP